MPKTKEIDKEFEKVKLEVWTFVMTNYLEVFTAKEIASKIDQPVEIVTQALRKLSQEERTECDNKKRWGLRWPPDPDRHGKMVCQSVAVELMLHLIQLAKKEEVKIGTRMFEDAKRAYRVMCRYIAPSKGKENDKQENT